MHEQLPVSSWARFEGVRGSPATEPEACNQLAHSTTDPQPLKHARALFIAAFLGSVLMRQPAFAQPGKPDAPTDLLSSTIVRAWMSLGANGRLHGLDAVRQDFPNLDWQTFNDTSGPASNAMSIRGYGTDPTGNDPVATYSYIYITPYARQTLHNPNVANVEIKIRKDRYCFKYGELDAHLRSKFSVSEYYSNPWTTGYVLWRTESIVTIFGLTLRPPDQCVERLSISSMTIP